MKVVYDIKDCLDAIDKWGARIDARIDALFSMEGGLAKTLNELVADFKAKLGNISEDSAQIKAAVVAVIALLQGVVAQNAALKARIDELIALNPTPEQLAALEEVSAGLDSQDADIDVTVKALNDATTANTGN